MPDAAKDVRDPLPCTLCVDAVLVGVVGILVPIIYDNYSGIRFPVCLLDKVLLQAKSLIADGVVRKVCVCFFAEGGRADRTPVERIAVDIQIDGENDGRTDQGSDEGDTRRRRDEDRSLDQTSLQVRAAALLKA